MSYYFKIEIKDNFSTRFSIGFTDANFVNRILPGRDSLSYSSGAHVRYRYGDCNGYGDGDSDTYGYGYDSLGSVAVHAERVFKITMGKAVIRELGLDFDVSYTMGDTVGAGVNYVTGQIFFTKNEKLVCFRPFNLKTTLYPTIGFEGMFPGSERKSTVQVNFKEPYVFDVSRHMQHSNLKTSKKWPLQTKLPFQSFFQ
jgi:hypothetical protein